MKITLMRHGMCEDDFLRKVIGLRDEHLNEDGARQVLKLKFKLQDKHFDYCFIAPLFRCFETALPLVGDRVEIIKDERLMEREMGELTERAIDEYNAFSFWDYSLNRDDYGIETIHSLFERCSSFLKFIDDNYSDKDFLIICSEEIYRALRHLILGNELEGYLYDGVVDNLTYEEFNYTTKKVEI